MLLQLPSNSIQQYNILRQWYYDSDQIPTPTQLRLFNDKDHSKLKKLAAILRANNYTDSDDEDTTFLSFTPILKASLKLTQRALDIQLHASLTNYHLQADQDLKVALSTIPNAGNGLYATQHIQTNDLVCHYSGLIHNFKSKNELVDQSYVLYLQYSDIFDEDIFVNAKTVMAVKARYLNDPLNPDLYNVKWHHSQTNKNNLRCGVIAIKDIYPGDELFIEYGSDYWDSSDVQGTVQCHQQHQCNEQLDTVKTEQNHNQQQQKRFIVAIPKSPTSICKHLIHHYFNQNDNDDFLFKCQNFETYFAIMSIVRSDSKSVRNLFAKYLNVLLLQTISTKTKTIDNLSTEKLFQRFLFVPLIWKGTVSNYLNLDWNHRILSLAVEKKSLAVTSAYISTLGGGYFMCRYVGKAQEMARKQLKIAVQLGDETLQCKCRTHLIYNDIQLGKFETASLKLIQEMEFAKKRRNPELCSIIESALHYCKKSKEMNENEHLLVEEFDTGQKNLLPSKVPRVNEDEYYRIRVVKLKK